jgi:small subunit ribosomal protein S16
MRVGKAKQPSYRVVVADSRMPRDGRIIETIGHYGPREEPSRIEIDGDRALGWLRKGAQPSEQVQKLLTITGVWGTFESEKGGKRIVTKLNRRGYATGKATPNKGKKKGASEAPAAEVPAADAPAEAVPAADAAPEASAAEESPTAEAPAAEPAADAPAEDAPAAEEPPAEDASGDDEAKA